MTNSEAIHQPGASRWRGRAQTGVQPVGLAMKGTMPSAMPTISTAPEQVSSVFAFMRYDRIGMSPRTPTIVPETTRRAVAEAVLRVVARGGVPAVSMRVVADEAGLSLGLVQRTVGTKDDLLLLATDRVIERADERVTSAGLSESLPARRFLDGLVDLMLTDDRDGIVWIGFLAHALTTPTLADALRRHEHDGIEAIALLLRAAQTAGELAPDADPDQDALALLAIVDGLGTQIQLGTCSAKQAQHVAQTFLDRLFPGSARRGSPPC